MKNTTNHKTPTTRRSFLRRTAVAAAAVSIVPRHVLGGPGNTPPSEKLNIAGIGVGGMGQNNIAACAAENIVALCDVDFALAGKIFERYPQAKRYKDFRVMLDQQKDIDAAIVATPDHTHAVVAMAAIQRGKHVYVQKPLAHSVYEARLLTEAARKHKVATQLGNQGHSCDGVRALCEWIADGAIGAVREVHAWTNRPVWPQSVEVERPKETPPVPDTLDWDLWIGPAPMRPYHPVYHPGTWRAWWDFGTGSLGDLGCHILDAPFWALKLKYATSVEGCISTYWRGLWQKTEPKNEQYPRSTIARFKFPAREGLPEVKLTWWDGGMMPPRPETLEEGRRMGDDDGGVLFLGDQGSLMCGCYGSSPRLIPESRMKDYKFPAKSIERIPGGQSGHERDWVRACKGGKPASSNFDYSGPLSEMVLMGNMAVRFPNRRLLWDGEKMAVTNDAEANSYVRRQYRQGWSL
jgi:predicted dehydrogenase